MSTCVLFLSCDVMHCVRVQDANIVRQRQKNANGQRQNVPLVHPVTLDTHTAAPQMCTHAQESKVLPFCSRAAATTVVWLERDEGEARQGRQMSVLNSHKGWQARGNDGGAKAEGED